MTLDNDENSRLEPKKNVKRRWSLLSLAFRFLGIGLLIMVGLVGWRFMMVRGQQKLLNAKLAALQAAGVAIDPAGVKRLHEEHTSRDSTEQWQTLFAELYNPEFVEAALALPYFGRLQGEDNRVPPRGESWESEAAAREFLTSTKALRARLRELAGAVNGNSVYFPMVYESGPTFGDIKEIDAINYATNLMTFDAFMAMRYNASATVLEDVRCLLGLSQLLRGNPSVFSLFIGTDSESRALQVVQGAIEQGALAQPQLLELVEILREPASFNGSFRLAVQGERGTLMSTLDSFAVKQGPFRYLLGSPKHRLLALDSLDRLEAAPSDDGDTFLKALDAIQYRPENDISPYSMGPYSADYLAPEKLIPLYAAGATAVRRQMLKRLASAAAGLQLYKFKHGKFPSELSQVADIGLDPSQLIPIGGKPFGYRPSEEGDSAILWGLSSLGKQVPDEPGDLNNPYENNKAWVWNLK